MTTTFEDARERALELLGQAQELLQPATWKQPLPTWKQTDMAANARGRIAKARADLRAAR